MSHDTTFHRPCRETPLRNEVQELFATYTVTLRSTAKVVKSRVLQTDIVAQSNKYLRSAGVCEP